HAVLSGVRRSHQGPELVAIERLVAGLAVRGTQLQFREWSDVREAIRRSRLRIVEELVDVRVVRAALGDDAPTYEETLVEQEQILLSVERERLHGLPILRGSDVGAAVH